MSLLFSTYPNGGRVLLGPPKGSDNCRHGYGLDLQRRTGQRHCAYCGVDLTDTFHHWLLMSVDHVVPTSVGKERDVPGVYMEDCINKVLACSGCNGIGNRYKAEGIEWPSEWTIESFVAVRDTIFVARTALIGELRANEVAFFASHPWETVR
jgi:hypothetical protein